MDGLVNRLARRLELELADRQNNLRLGRMKRAIARHSPRTTGQRPVIFFRASTGLLRMSLNTAFPLLASWALGLVGVPVLHFVCQAGMSRCVQGTDRDDASALPPCKACIKHSRRLYRRDGKNSSTYRFTYATNDELASELQRLDLASLQNFQFR